MRISPLVLCASVAFAGVVGLAVGGLLSLHTLTIRLPDGGVEKIYYSGAAPPRLAVTPALAADGPDEAPFDDLQRASLEMDRETSAMLRDVDAFQPLAFAGPGAFDTAAFAAPDGARSYSFVSTLAGGGVCTRSVEITSQGPGRDPRIVTRASGDCGSAAARRGGQARALAPAPSQAPPTPDLRTADFTPRETSVPVKVAAAF